MMKYVPLHVHSEYSILDSTIRIKDLCKFAKENNWPAVAVTDHGTMYGAIELYTAAKETGIKPIIGCEFYVCEGDVLKDKTCKTMHHLVLLAKNNEGYQNLVKLASIAATEAFYYKPRINHKMLAKYSKGLICLSGCIGGELGHSILDGNMKKAQNTAKFYKDLFGEDYYIELADHRLDAQKRCNLALIEIAQKLDIELVITNDSHYLRQEDAEVHDTFLCEQTKSLKQDKLRGLKIA